MTQDTIKTVAFIVARLNSSRFPAKHLRQIGGQSLLSWCLFHLQQAKSIDTIVLTTPAEQTNLPLRAFAEEKGIELFWYQGNPNEETTRLCCAAQHYQADICVLISGDCPLVDGECVDQMVNALKSDPDKDYVSLAANQRNSRCMLQGVSVARREAWQRAEALSHKPEMKEHHFPVLYHKKEQFSAHYCQINKNVYGQLHRLSVDTFADLTFFNTVYTQLHDLNSAFTLINVVSLLEQHPRFKEINKHVHQRQVAEYIPDIVYLVPTLTSQTQEYRSHQLRDIDTALFLIESLGWPIRFLTNESKLKQILSHKGIQHLIYTQNSEMLNYIQSLDTLPYLIVDNASNQLNRKILPQLISSSSSTLLLGEEIFPAQQSECVIHLSDFYKEYFGFNTGVKAISDHINNLITGNEYS